MQAETRSKAAVWVVALLLAGWLPTLCAASEEEADAGAEALATALVEGSGTAVADVEMAADVAQSSIRLYSPTELERRLFDQPERIPALYRTWAAGLVHGGLHEPRDERLLHHAVAVAARRAERIFAGDAAADRDVDLLLAMLQLDPSRFFGDEAFRRRVATSWGALRDSVPSTATRLRLLERLTSRGLDDFDAVETIAGGWGLVPRDSADREAIVEQADPADGLEPIEASIFSLPPFLGVDASARLLASVRSTAPDRRILVLANHEHGRRLRAALADPETGDGGVTVLPTLGLDYSPWPRDPLTLTRRVDGGLHVVLRGNVQRGREADQWMGRALVQSLPEELDQRWRGVSWERARLPFHNGQILDAGGVSWVSVHSLEPRILELLGTDRLPVERFAEEDGRRFVEAARAAAAELAALRRRPVRFVHALPNVERSGQERAKRLYGLAGGAGIDLDSVLTLLPRPDGSVEALVADVDLGTEHVRESQPEALHGLSIYGLPADRARDAVLAGHATPTARALDLFFERVADHLRIEGLTVRRLPLLWVDPASTTRPDRAQLAPFLINWNNVVLEEVVVEESTRRVADGFGSGWQTGDRLARQVFAEAGYTLRLHPPLVESVVRNGGFRCSSQHVRSSAIPGRAILDTPEDAF